MTIANVLIIWTHQFIACNAEEVKNAEKTEGIREVRQTHAQAGEGASGQRAAALPHPSNVPDEATTPPDTRAGLGMPAMR